ncbi:sel1 repeat family protein [Methylocapsa palsarum]|uniref:Sel1 repeat-containing protein n=1 Tax=Methylocapsa palsarum TaxID=1612308 RepID=A0A1I3YER1_9HYPH|nr:sel1 repeat family protein [Methylocapsa palsarum]SFK30348.1 hypothetical protein SAMN05444581_105225 [Methylocapsa palsarum]
MTGSDKFHGDPPYKIKQHIIPSSEILAFESFRKPSPLAPIRTSKTLPEPGARSPFGILGRPTMAIAVTAGLAFLFVGNPGAMCSSGANKSNGELSIVSSLFLSSAMAAPVNVATPELLVNEAPPRPMDAAIPLGVSVRNSDESTILIIEGLVEGTTLSTGRPISDGKWWLYAGDIENALILPPPHFVGTMVVTVALIQNLAETRRLPFKWVEAKVPSSSVQSQAQGSEPNPQSASIHQIAPQEIAALIKRGNDLISSGDFAAARLVLQRAAEAGDERAALALAGTYDPETLKKLSLHGLSPDIAMARHWYEKAKALGSRDASQRLEMLARKPE